MGVGKDSHWWDFQKYFNSAKNLGCIIPLKLSLFSWLEFALRNPYIGT
jgi:hypothetical protein